MTREAALAALEGIVTSVEEGEEGEEGVTVQDREGRTWEIANPSDHDWNDHLFAFQFGAVGTENVLVWAKGVDSGLEIAAAWLSDNGKMGHFMGNDQMLELQEGAREELGPDAPEEEVQEKAEADLTYTEAGYLMSHEWFVDEAPPELVKLAKQASITATADGDEEFEEEDEGVVEDQD